MPSRLQRLYALGTAARSVTADLVALQQVADGVETSLANLSSSKGSGAVDAVSQLRGALSSASEGLQHHLQSTESMLHSEAQKLLGTGGDILRTLVGLVGTLAQVAGSGGGITPSGGQLTTGSQGQWSFTGGAGAAAGNLYGAGGGGLGNAPPPSGSGTGGGGSGGSTSGGGGATGSGGNGEPLFYQTGGGYGTTIDPKFPTLGNAGADLNLTGAQLPPLPGLFDEIRGGIINFEEFLSDYASQRIPSGVNAIQDALSKLNPREYEQKILEIAQALRKGQLQIDEVLEYLEKTGSKVQAQFAAIIKAFREGNISIEVLKYQLSLLAISLPEGAFTALAEELADQAIQQGNR
ncbi:MAG TPA: hypothetical protein VGS22_16445 [Thermoanaerobaculia bacterium]|jgi:hypothetical protein|nr:hypothetical protein [Thermoanaerobaculia bacterium]